MQNYSSKFKIFNSKLQLLTFNFALLILLAFLLATAYTTNAWDGLIYALLTGLIFLYLAHRSKNYQPYAIRYALILVGAILFSLPFSLHFKPFVSGIGVICAPEFLTKLGKLGPFIFEADHCQRSPIWQLIILHGFWYFWVISFLIFLFKKEHSLGVSRLRSQYREAITSDVTAKRNEHRYPNRLTLTPSDVFVLILIGLSTLLILLPEFIYAKDIYPGHYRANTMFKLGYEAFMMLGIATAYIIIRMMQFKVQSSKFKVFYGSIGIIGLFLVSIYPYFAISSYYGELKTYRGLDGLIYLRDLYPTDYEGILWLRDNIKGQPVILESAGESYTDYARVSANTGLPTAVGWPVHEWLWRGTYDEAGKRVSEVEKLYTTTDITAARQLLEKYNVEYVFVGALERQKYPAINEEKFKLLGTVIYENGETIVYQLHNRPQ